MGRVTFEQLLTFGTWPYGDTPMAVLSTTLQALPETLSSEVNILAADPRNVLEILSQQGASRIYVDGGATIQGFLGADLIDLLWAHASTETFKNGLVKSTYLRSR